MVVRCSLEPFGSLGRAPRTQRTFQVVYRTTDLGVVRNRVEDIGQEPCLVVVPAKSMSNNKETIVRSSPATASTRRARSLVSGATHISARRVYLSGREVSQSPSIAVVSVRTDTLRSVVN